MFDKHELVRAIKAFQEEHLLEGENCWVSHGGSMVMLGLREKTNDVDLNVTKTTYDRLVALGFEETPIADDFSLISFGDVDVHAGSQPASELVEHDGVFFVSLEQTLRDYKMLGREKDRATIVLLESLVNQ